MSVNILRVLRKRNKSDAKSGRKSTSTAPDPPKQRKGNSLSAPPVEVSILASPSHQHSKRKISLNMDSPIHSRPPASPLVTKSSSVGNFRRDSSPNVPNTTPAVPTVNIMPYPDDSQALDRQGIIDITVDVQNFLAAISRLKQAMEDLDNDIDDVGSRGDEVTEPPPDIVLKRLSELVQVVQTCLGQHPGMQSTEIKNTAMTLMQTYQDCPHRSASMCPGCGNAIDSLIDAFTSSVSEHLTGESVQLPLPQRKGLEKSGLSHSYLKGFSKSHDNLAVKYNSYLDLTQPIGDEAVLVVDQIDQALSEVQGSVEVASKYLKSRIKYHREVTSYLNKRAQIEARYHQQMSKLCKSTQGALKELSTQEPCLPLMDVVRGSIDQDMKFATNCNATYNFQVGGKITDILEQKNSEYDKRRKEYTQTWAKEEKKLADARSTMKAAKAKYEFLGQDLIRVKNLISLDPYGKQADKRKKEAADYETKWQDAEMAYKNTLALCNDCQYQVHVAAKKSILCAYRRIMIDADTQLQNGLETYFILQHNFFQTLTEPMVQSLGAVQDYGLGSEFMNHISRHPRQAEELEDYLFEEFDPEAAEMNCLLTDRAIPNSVSNDAFLPGDGPPRERASSPNIHHISHTPNHEARSYSQGQVSPHISRPRPRSIAHLISDTDAKDSRRLSDISGATRDGGTTSPPLPFDDDVPMSRNAMAHPFKKLRGPARCRECDTYVYFHGFECETCGLACHRKCLANLAIKCGSKRLARKMNTFGVDFQKHLKATKRYIPIIATECIAELDLRGLDTRGLYRISSAKSKLEHLCQLFETGGDRVDLTDRPAHLIGSCLKLYFRQLPEPLLTFALYQDFVTFAREASYILPCKIESLTGEKAESAKKMLDRLKGLLQKLPYENYITLAKLLYHLNRVSSPEHVKNNFMPPSNLGIVFAPNLLRQREMVASLRLLADMTAQAKVVEIMISHVPEIIHVPDDQIMDQDVEVSVNKEVLVDDPVKSPLLDNDDAMTTDSRTPNTTPPERRRENVSELSDVLNALQLVGRRNSQPNISLIKPPHPQLLEVRNSSASISAPVFSNLPLNVGTGEKDQLTALGRWLRTPPTHTPTLEKMLTPVQERQRETDSESSDDDENSIIISGSQKLDHVLSRSESGLSNPSMSWTLFDDASEVSSLRDSISILSEEDNSLPRGFRMNGNNDRKNSKEELCESAQLNHKESSQGSDDSSPFVDNNSLFVAADYPTSPMSGPPIRILGETEAELMEMNRQKMSIISIDEGIIFGADASTQSPTSTSEDRLLFEEFESPESTLKPSKLNRYERYERYRMANPIGEGEVTIEQSQGSTQDSVGTLTDGVPSEIDETSPTESQKEYECEDNQNGDETAEGLSENWEAMRDTHKHIDSGIDDRGSPDTRSEKSSSLKRASFPEIIGLRNYRQLVDFDSQESGLADSPDSASLLNEPQPLTVITGPHSPPDTHSLVTHVLRSPTDPLAQQFMTSGTSAEFASRERRSKSSEPDFGGTRKQSDFEVVVDLNTEQPQLISNELGASVESIDGCETDDCLTKSMSAPRSLESVAFSSIARNPIQRHSTYDSIVEKRPRASSVEPASPKSTSTTSFSPKHELHYKALANARSTTVISPAHSTSTASSESDLSLQGKSLSRSLNALTSSSPTSSPNSSMKKKKKWGKRLQRTFKPALRVLKITPNNTPITANREDIVRDIHLSSHTPEASPSPSEIETNRVRMVSPDSLSNVAKKSSRTMQRSRSCDHLLESSNCTGNAPIAMGSLQVITEPKSKSKKAKFFSNFHGPKFNKSKNKVTPTEETQSAPPKRRKSTVDSPAGENPNKSPKTRKKSRLPHFV